MKKYGDRLRECREELGMNQTDFGAVGGVQQQAQVNYEKSGRKPDINYLMNIARIGCDIQYIVTGVRARNALSEDELKLLDLYKRSEANIKAAVMAVLNSGQNR